MRTRIKWLFAAVIAVNLLYNANLPLHFDEAYYWIWSKRLALSYFDHPPMVAYLIRLFTVWGDGEFFIRLAAVFATTCAAFLVYFLGRDMFSPRVGELALVLFLFLPLVHIGFLVTTPDSPLVLFWALVLYLFYQGIFRDRAYCLYGAGIAGGLALMSKYTAVLLFAALFLFLLFSPYRRVFRSGRLYIACGLAFLVFLPVVVWNAGHDWVSFRFQFDHGVAARKVFNPDTAGEFLGAQAAIFNPLFFLALLYYTARHWRRNLGDPRLAFLFWTFAFPFLFFGYHSLFKKSEANWTAPAYLAGVVLLAYWLDRFRRRQLVAAGLVLSLAIIGLVKSPEFFPGLPREMVMKQQFQGWNLVFHSGSRYVESGDVVLSDNYETASLAWYYLAGRPQVHILTPARFSQFDYWRQELAGRSIRRAVFFGGKEERPELEKIFMRVEPVDTIYYRDRFTAREIQVYRCYGYLLQNKTVSAITQ